MTTSKTLKAIKIILLIFYILILLFYLGIILPEYLACCDEHKNETNMGVDYWGNQIDCNGESKLMGEFFFQLSSMIVVGFSFVLIIIFYVIFHFKKTLK